MQATKRTTVLAAKPVENCLRIAAYPGYYDRTGRTRLKNWKLLSGAKQSSRTRSLISRLKSNQARHRNIVCLFPFPVKSGCTAVSFVFMIFRPGPSIAVHER